MTRLAILVVCFGLLIIPEAFSQEVSNPDHFLMSTFDRQEVLDAGKELIELPNPQGPHLVGTVSYHWVDRSRDEIITSEDHDFRQVIVQVWYPAVPTKDSAPASYLPEIEWVRSAFRTQKGDIFKKLAADFERYGRVLTTAIPHAKVDNIRSTYPLIIFGTGGNMSRHHYSAVMEELASQGYIAVSISHPYSSLDFFPSGGLQDDYPHWRAGENASEEQIEQLEQKLTTYLAEDARFVLDQMILLNINDPSGRFTGRINLDQVGIMGHSRGGGTVTKAASSDSRFKAAIIYDNIGSEPEIMNGLNQPVMTLRQPWSESRTKRLHTFLSNNRSFAWEVVLDSANHFTFSDMPMVDSENYESKDNPYRLFRTVMKYTLDFLNSILKNQKYKTLNTGEKNIDGVSIKSFNSHN